MKVYLVVDRHGPVAVFASRDDADWYAEHWKKHGRVRKVWVTEMPLNYGQI